MVLVVCHRLVGWLVGWLVLVLALENVINGAKITTFIDSFSLYVLTPVEYIQNA